MGGDVAEIVKVKRGRRSRAEVSRALVTAASTLFAERPSGRVTVREMACRADVNPALVYRYFGNKQTLMRAAMERSQRQIASKIEGVADIQEDVGVIFHATVDEKEFVAALARSLLDGVLPDFPAGYPAMTSMVRRIHQRLAAGGAEGGSGRHDPRVVVACLGSLVLGYALFGSFIRRGTGLAEEPLDWIDDQITTLLHEIVGLALD